MGNTSTPRLACGRLWHKGIRNAEISAPEVSKALNPLEIPKACNTGALISRIGFGVYYTIIIIRNPQNPILIIVHYTIYNYKKAPPKPYSNYLGPYSIPYS